jgi:hypothetical protein
MCNNVAIACVNIEHLKPKNVSFRQTSDLQYIDNIHIEVKVI